MSRINYYISYYKKKRKRIKYLLGRFEIPSQDNKNLTFNIKVIEITSDEMIDSHLFQATLYASRTHNARAAGAAICTIRDRVCGRIAPTYIHTYASRTRATMRLSCGCSVSVSTAYVHTKWYRINISDDTARAHL